MNGNAVETLELRLTDEQMAAIIQRVQRRKRKIVECGEIDLGELNGDNDAADGREQEVL
ncbi:MAG TPA: hypothetical protein VNV41_07600 [Candidatus Acidoferrales bacterium]|jgi:hypothetical protein|nr:hypothetical protein [Candidatus Acidoferrales bacterium]